MQRFARIPCRPLGFAPWLAAWAWISTAGVAFAAERANPRWAIVAGEDLRECGVADLLTVQLSDMGVDLVERERLDLAAKELEVAACFGSAAAGQRWRLGQWLQADGLLLLSSEEREKRKHVKVVVSECVYGARLRVEYLPYAAGDAPQVARRAAGVLQAARQQFAGGIRCLVAVAPFLSRDLAHDYDHWQNGYAALVEQALLTVPGVAVLEVDEARAIGRELAVTGAEVRERIVPLLVDGEYATTRGSPETPPAVRLTVRVTQGDRRVEVVSRDQLAEEEVVRVLAERLPQKLMNLAEAGSVVPLNRNQQFALLCQRAEAFAELGQWPQATGLREAALLLQPQSVEQRLRLIRDCRRWAPRLFPPTRKRVSRGADASSRSGTPQDDEIPPQARVEFFRHLAQNIESVVAAGVLPPCDVVQLLGVLSAHGWIDAADGVDTPPELAVEQRRLFWNVVPRLPSLDASAPLQVADPTSHGPQCNCWPDAVVYTLFHHLPKRQQGILGPHGERHPKSGWDDRDTLEDLYRLLTEVLPRDPLDPGIVRRMAGAGPWNLVAVVREGRVPADEAQRVLTRLKQAGPPAAEFYACCGELALKALRPEVTELSVEDVREAGALLARFTREVQPQGADKRWQYAERALRRLQDEVHRKAGWAVTPDPQPIGYPIPPFESDRPLAFRPIPGPPGSWTRLRPCGSEFDLMWASNVIRVMRERGKVTSIFSSTTPKDLIADACWDGENIWAASIQTGVRVLSPQGQVLGHWQFGRELPPCSTEGTGGADPPVWLYPASTGRCLILGHMKPELRSWIAVASLARSADDTDSPTLASTVIHTATKTSAAPEDSLDDAYFVCWLSEYRDPEAPSRRLLLIGRHERTGERFSGRRPLAVDLDSLRVSMFPTHLPACAVDHQDVHVADGRFLWTSCYGTDVFSPGTDDPQRPHWNRQTLVLPSFQCPDVARCQLLTIDGQVYRPGYHWYRLDASRGHAERLHRERLPYRHVYEYYGVSVHYGLVAWNNGETVHQVVIGDPVEPDADLKNEFFYVPYTHCAQHLDAVRALRAAGGRVDADLWPSESSVLYHPETAYVSRDTSIYPWSASGLRQPKRERTTIVCLPADWRGDAATLDRLRDLWRLRHLWVVGANVDNAAMGQLKGLNLRALALIDSRVDNEGLAALAHWSNLNVLRLEDTQDRGMLSDAGLKHLTAAPSLQELQIRGPGFTDEALPYLKAMPKLRLVHDHGSWLSDRAIEELRQQKIGVMRYLW